MQASCEGVRVDSAEDDAEIRRLLRDDRSEELRTGPADDGDAAAAAE